MASVSPLIRPTRAVRAEEALTALYERHGNRVLRFCRRWLRSREEAEDAAQTTFLNAFRGLERGIVPAHEEAWLLAIARNVCLARTDAVRRRAVEVPRDPHSFDEFVAAPVEANELEGLDEGFAALTELQRRAVFLREWHELSYREIAETLALSQAAVETLLFRARRTLARHVRRPLGIGSFAPWLRSLVEGAAGKLALGAAAVAVTATTGTIAIVPRHEHAHTPHVRRDVPVTRSTRSARQAPQAKVGSPRRRVRAAQPTPASVEPQTMRGIAPAEPPVTTAPPVASTGPVAPASPPPAPTIETTTTTEPTLPSPVQTTAAYATGTVGTVAAGAADTVDQATASVTASVQQTTQAVANVVTTLVDPHRLFP